MALLRLCLSRGVGAGMSCARGGAELRRRHGAEPNEPFGGHRVLVREMQSDGVGGALPGAGMGNLLQGHLRLHVHGRHHRLQRMVQLGRPQQRDVSPLPHHNLYDEAIRVSHSICDDTTGLCSTGSTSAAARERATREGFHGRGSSRTRKPSLSLP